ncbi:AfsR/SARP family transcriptional regulator [Nocardiopsis quinghaiensis]|uniref:AfsR/SARP family transcriptional regulator n=1 Tax=Nocardiopsis quinghaiensis TaxID=464995 RepID=UPI00167FF943|nr:BTAD domain-containing putative transcriptional regulator [Nocardiopsis quinghaiensis]
MALSVDGEAPALGGGRQRAFFSALALRANRSVSREEIVHAVWGSEQPHSVTSSVHTYVARLRRALEPERRPRSSSQLLEFDGLGYRLNIDPKRVDAHLFENRLDQAKRSSGSLHDSLAEHEEALALWEGKPLVGIPGPLAQVERFRLEELHLSALEDRFELMLALGLHREALHGLSGLTQAYPLRERLRDLLMSTYYLCGRRAEALMEYHDLRDELVRQMGIEPGSDLRRKYLRILRGEPLLDHDPPGGTTRVRASRTVPAQLPRNIPDLIGRDTETKYLHSLIERPVPNDRPLLIHIDGAPGTGKTALAVHFAHEVSSLFPDGQLYLDLHGFSASREPLATDQALRHMLFGLGEPVPDTVPRERLLGLFRSLTSGKRLLILLDNADSPERVRPLLPGSPRCAVIVTGRDRMTSLSIRDGARRLTLEPLTDEDAALLVLRSAARAFSEQSAPRPPTLPGPADVVELCRSHSNAPLPLHSISELLVQAASSEPRRDSVLERLPPDSFERSFASEPISWSYDSLPPDSATVFRSVGLSDAPFLEVRAVAHMLCGDVSGVREHLVKLSTANLLRETGHDHVSMPRYLKLYARERSRTEDSPERRAGWARRIAHYYTSFAVHACRVIAGEQTLPGVHGPGFPGFGTRDQALAWLRSERTVLRSVTREAGRTGRGL